MPNPRPDPDDPWIEAAVLDMDGVVTDTARVHFVAWKAVFDAVLDTGVATGEAARPFTHEDYLAHVDGIPRLDGVRGFLASRGVSLPQGAPDDRGLDTVHGIGALKNDRFLEALEREGADAFPDTVRFVEALRAMKIPVGVFSASRNAAAVLKSAGVIDLFDVRVDGNDARAADLPGKPDPAILAETARRLGADPRRTIAIEDAVLGVEAGARGGFAHVVGIDRTGTGPGHALDLAEHGADLVVADLGRLLAPGNGAFRRVADLPAAEPAAVAERLSADRPIVLLDLDAAIAADGPALDRAALGEALRALARAARLATASPLPSAVAAALAEAAGPIRPADADRRQAGAPCANGGGATHPARALARAPGVDLARDAILQIGDAASVARFSPLIAGRGVAVAVGGDRSLTVADARLAAASDLAPFLSALADRLATPRDG